MSLYFKHRIGLFIQYSCHGPLSFLLVRVRWAGQVMQIDPELSPAAFSTLAPGMSWYLVVRTCGTLLETTLDTLILLQNSNPYRHGIAADVVSVRVVVNVSHPCVLVRLPSLHAPLHGVVLETAVYSCTACCLPPPPVRLHLVPACL